MLDATYFTAFQRVKDAVATAQKCADKQFSDIIDGQHQYVDLVMEGGGVLGIALVGYTYVLEQAGIRFLGIGGTSAGSINALMIAALGKPFEEKSSKLVQILANMPMASFIDGDSDAKDFTNAVINKAGMVKLLWKAAQIMDNLKEDLGLHSGKKLLTWLEQTLEKEAGIKSTKQLEDKLSAVPESIRIRKDIRPDSKLAPQEAVGRLAMVAADVTTATKVEFPKMAHLYWDRPDNVNPACYARASMSIPFFFHPYLVSNCPTGKEADWKQCGYNGSLPREVIFMDGGIMSNFPINLFHQPYDVPLAPTFGIKIGIDRIESERISKPAQLLSAIFDAARHTLDDDFVRQNPDYQQLVAMIDTKQHNWLNFEMENKDKQDLFALGAEAAAEFLCKFDWDKYKKTREGIAEAFNKKRQAEDEEARSRAQ